MTKFKVGDVVKLVNIDGLYSSQPYGDNVRLELGEIYPVVEVDVDLIRVMKSNGEIEGCYPYRVELVAEEQTAESLKALIFSLRKEREQTLSKLKDLDTQEAEAISQLNALGFSLFEEGKVNSSPSKTVLYAEDIEEDMTDPKNWKVGDFLEQHKFSFKATYTPIVGIEQGKWYTEDTDGESSFGDYNDMRNDFKFHSRPLK